ncbi:PE family protein [Mycobacterium spongiae]|uniref:PE family protein n=1 Tax=Mycobacterium spongiae TaxID=886343 RepID=UPI003CCEF436
MSAAIAALFGAHGQAYQTMSAQAAEFHPQFAQAMTAGADALAEAANASPMAAALDVVNGLIQGVVGASADRRWRRWDRTGPGRRGRRIAITATAATAWLR